MGVHQPKAAKARLAGSGSTDVGQVKAVGISHDDVLHLALAVEEDSHLPVDAFRDFGEVPRQLGADHLMGRSPPPVGVPEKSKLVCLQPEGIAQYVGQAATITGLPGTGLDNPVGMSRPSRWPVDKRQPNPPPQSYRTPAPAPS